MRPVVQPRAHPACWAANEGTHFCIHTHASLRHHLYDTEPTICFYTAGHALLARRWATESLQCRLLQQGVPSPLRESLRCAVTAHFSSLEAFRATSRLLHVQGVEPSFVICIERVTTTVLLPLAPPLSSK